MDGDFAALVTFVAITGFTPGPNNISCASMGILYGYRRTLRYIAGIVVGVLFLMLVSALISARLLALLPDVERILRIVGALYILWLAYHTFKSSYTFEEEEQGLLGFVNGFVLQWINPKAIVYALTLYTTFLSGVVDKPFLLLLSVLILAVVAFANTSVWTLFGATIRSQLHDRPQVQIIINSALALLLMYTAVELSGILELLSG